MKWAWQIFVFIMYATNILYVYLHARGQKVPVDITQFDMPSSAFNPSFDGLLVWRYSSRDYCPDTLLPLRPCSDKYDESRIGLRHHGISKLVQTPIGDFEDPRILKGPKGQYAIVCTRYFETKARICVIFVSDTDPWTPISIVEFTSAWPQKNWMAIASERPGTKLILRKTLYDTSPEILNWPLDTNDALECPIYRFQTILDTPFDSNSWRGSSPWRPYGYSHLAFVHKRLPRTFLGRWLPEYIHALVETVDFQHITFLNIFYLDIINYPGFTFITDLRPLKDSIEVYLGVTDCYALKAFMPYAVHENHVRLQGYPLTT